MQEKSTFENKIQFVMNEKIQNDKNDSLNKAKVGISLCDFLDFIISLKLRRLNAVANYIHM